MQQLESAMGLSTSDAIRLLMPRITDERHLPFEVKAPNATTRKAIAELESGKGKKLKDAAALIADVKTTTNACLSKLPL